MKGIMGIDMNTNIRKEIEEAISNFEGICISFGQGIENLTNDIGDYEEKEKIKQELLSLITQENRKAIEGFIKWNTQKTFGKNNTNIEKLFLTNVETYLNKVREDGE